MLHFASDVSFVGITLIRLIPRLSLIASFFVVLRRSKVQKTVRVPSLEFACLERRSNVFQLSRAHVRGCVEATPSSFEFKFLTRFRACRCANAVNFCRGENWCFIECCFEYSDIKDYRGIVDKERKWFGSENRPCLENERRATNAQRRVRRQGKFIYLFNVWQISIFQTLFA